MVIAAKTVMGVDITEIYSPERVVKVANAMGLMGWIVVQSNQRIQLQCRRRSKLSMKLHNHPKTLTCDRQPNVHHVQCIAES